MLPTSEEPDASMWDDIPVGTTNYPTCLGAWDNFRRQLHPHLLRQRNSRRNDEGDQDADTDEELEPTDVSVSQFLAKSDEDDAALGGEWALVDDTDVPSPSAAPDARGGRGNPRTLERAARVIHSNRPTLSSPPTLVRLSPRVDLMFDDHNSVLVDSDDHDLNWVPRHLDYEVPIRAELLHETYPFERDYPNAAPILRQLFAMPSVQVASALTRIVRGGSAATLDAFYNHAEQAVVSGRLVADDAIAQLQCVRHIFGVSMALSRSRWNDTLYGLIMQLLYED